MFLRLSPRVLEFWCIILCGEVTDRGHPTKLKITNFHQNDEEHFRTWRHRTKLGHINATHMYVQCQIWELKCKRLQISLQVAYHSSSSPDVRVVALVPVDTEYCKHGRGCGQQGQPTRSCVQQCEDELPKSHRERCYACHQRSRLQV